MGRLIVGQLVSLGAAEALRMDRLKQQPVARALVQQVVDRLSGGDPSKLGEINGAEENVTFALPRELQ